MTYHPDFHSPTYSYRGTDTYEAPGAGHRNPQEIMADMRVVRQTINPKDDPSTALIVEFVEAMAAHEMVLYQP